MAKKLPAINTAQMADISFLLLTFFMMTSAINTEQGIPRRLPPPSEEKTQVDINRRNVFNVMVNFNDEILANGEHVPLSQLTSRAKEFLENPLNNPHLPEKELRLIENMGEFPVSKGVLSLTNDQSTSYNMYVQVQNELQRAVNELRDKVSLQFFGKVYDKLDTTLQKAVQRAVPMNISEAPPQNFGKAE
ncbi:MAG: biopolymer transporter ExbD [Bacteroidetes bacterium]|nr:biopolymer transporter ExbD [Bacteroidota bacterium]MCL2303471.1 biopolymer transporter ExbD [Lentimicrobiaceae bacterium]